MASRYDYHKGFDSRWYVTWGGKAIAAYPSKQQAVCKFITIRRYEILLGKEYTIYG